MEKLWGNLTENPAWQTDRSLFSLGEGISTNQFYSQFRHSSSQPTPDWISFQTILHAEKYGDRIRTDMFRGEWKESFE